MVDDGSGASPGNGGGDVGKLSRVIGLIASTVLWIVIFGGGVTVDTTEARFALAPLDRVTNDRNRVGLERLAILTGAEIRSDATRLPSIRKSPEVASAVSVNAERAGMVGGDVAQAAIGPQVESSGAEAARDEELVAILLEWANGLSSWQKIGYFGICLACYSPINIAVLALVAGMLGGCLSNLYIASIHPSVRDRIDERRVDVLSESPIVASVRGLLAYICILSGLYAFFDDPFRTPTLSQYVKLAGFASGLAFTVRYDRTKFDWLLDGITAKTSQGKPAVESPKPSVR
jgi:hypothetical protein